MFHLMACVQNCVVLLHGPLQALYLHRLHGCHVQAGPIGGATFGEDLCNCTLMIASHQARLHHVKDSQVYVRPGSDPIIEHCENLGFAPMPDLPYVGFARALEVAELPANADDCAWRRVRDFQHPGSEVSPSWHVITGPDQVPPKGASPAVKALEASPQV
jgi:hypothetical protein